MKYQSFFAEKELIRSIELPHTNCGETASLSHGIPALASGNKHPKMRLLLPPNRRTNIASFSDTLCKVQVQRLYNTGVSSAVRLQQWHWFADCAK